MSAALHSLGAAEAAARIAAGELRSADLVDASLDRVRRLDGELGCFLELFEDRARAEAEAVDEARMAGRSLGPLAGVPVAIKDNFARQGHLATCASRILEGFVAPYTSTAVARLERAGAVILGRTNMDEFAMGSSTEHSSVRPVRNPFDRDRVPGGSSGGSTAAVAARLCPLALGSDTGGSVRQPAALCGVTGLKPTYGRVSRYGLIAFASSLDTVAPVARTAEDLALGLQVLAGEDPADSTSFAAAVPEYASGLTRDLKGLRVGLAAEAFGEGTDPEVEELVREAVTQLRSLGAEIVPVELPHLRYGIAAYYLICTSEASSNLARYDGVRYGLRVEGDGSLESMYSDTRVEGFGDEVRLRILLGAFCLCSGYYDDYYLKASKARTLMRRDFERAFAQCDVLAAPTSPFPAFRLGEKLDDPLAMYRCDALTVPASLAGIPALSVPCGFTAADLPVGLQLMGPPLGEPTLLRAAHAYQHATGHHTREPDL